MSALFEQSRLFTLDHNRTAELNRARAAREFLVKKNVTDGTHLTMTYIWDGPAGHEYITVSGPCRLIWSTHNVISAIHIQHRINHHALLGQITALKLATVHPRGFMHIR